MKNFLLLSITILMVSCGSEDSTEGDVLFEKGEYARAIDAYSEYLATNPDHIKTLYNRGRSYEELGDSEKAKLDFEKIVEIDPYNINAFLSLSKISYNDGNYGQVLHFSKKAIELNENSARAHFFSARASHQLGYVDQALESYNNAISINKDFGEAYLYRGALKIGIEKKRSACEDFNFAKSLGVEAADSALSQYCK